MWRRVVLAELGELESPLVENTWRQGRRTSGAALRPGTWDLSPSITRIQCVLAGRAPRVTNVLYITSVICTLLHITRWLVIICLYRAASVS